MLYRDLHKGDNGHDFNRYLRKWKYGSKCESL